MSVREFEMAFPTRLAVLIEAKAKELGFAMPEGVEELLYGIMSYKSKDGSVTWKMLVQPRKGSDIRTKCLLKMYRWHAGFGGNNLATPMTYCHLEDFDELDSLAQVIVLLIHRRASTPGGLWAQELGARRES